jgi:signal transduction histidine kinase
MDITEQLKTEKMLRLAYEKETKLNKLKSAFLANMSHEIRTPLNAVVGYSDLLEDEINGGNIDDLGYLITAMKEGVNRLLSLIENVVEVSMLESGDYKLDVDQININNSVLCSLEKVKQQTRTKNISIDIDLNDGLPLVSADAIKFEKILEELLNNAVKYNRENGIILLRTYLKEKKVIVEVTDTGIGIEENKIRKIFEPFSQVEAEGYKRQYEGAGLGITIAYKLTKLMKGEFEIDSMPNEGTTVRIMFPQL